MYPKYTFLIFLLFSGLLKLSQAQIYPVPLSQRIDKSHHIVLAQLEAQHAFRSEKDFQIYTLNILKVNAYLKGMRSDHQIGLLSPGGTLETEGQITYPGVRLQYGKNYALFLEPDPLAHHHPAFPDILHMRAYACVQGALPMEHGQYQDLLFEALSERELLQQVYDYTSELPRDPEGNPYIVRNHHTPPSASRMVTISSVSSLSATGLAGGTIDTPRVARIVGMGFDPFAIGSTGSTIEFSSALDGGLSFIGLDNPTTDILSWSDTEIQVKIPGDAGSGPLRLSIFSQTPVTFPITIDWAVIPQYSTFQNWPSSTRQRLELLRESSVTNNGYSFQFDNTYWTNLDAVNSFLRAVQTWRCNTFVNLSFDPSPNNAVYVSGNGSQVRFASAATLGAGVLGQAHLRTRTTFSALLPACVQQNTLWYVTDMDILFVDNPAPFSWNFGPNPTLANSYDFESVALKMVGLATGLGYINQSGTAMYYTIGDGQDIRNLTANEIVAGTHKVTHSVTSSSCKTQLAGNGLMTVVSAQDCILQLPDGPQFPDPTAELPFQLVVDREKNLLQLEWLTPEKGAASLLLYDMQGKSAGRYSWYQEGKGMQSFDLQGLSSGMYAYSLQWKEHFWQGKILK